MDGDIPAWRPLEEEEVMRCRVFSVHRRHLREDPVSGEPTPKEGDFFVISTPDWVNVVALTPDDELLLIEQWRMGIDAVTLEIPGGMVDPGEDPAAAAARELVEETGYEAARISRLGAVHPNPAIQGNRCHTFLAEGCVRTQTPSFDGNERIHTRLVPWAEATRLAARGTISHALVVAALGLEGLRRVGALRAEPTT